MDETNKIDGEELKKTALKVLCAVRDVCDEQNIKYFLDGGTLLGAVRHGGFIPWDDDIDICMPRPDYDRFIAYCKNNETSFGIVSHETDEKYTELSAKAFARDTVCKELFVNKNGAEYGVYVDIFPVDGLGANRKSALKLLNKSKFKRSLLTASNWQKFFKSKTRGWLAEPVRFAFYILSKGRNQHKLIEKIENIYKDYDFYKSEKVGVVCGCYGDREVMNASVYAETVYLKFENETFAAMGAYDEFLTNLYGDYMQLPPESKRVSRHTFNAYRK